MKLIDFKKVKDGKFIKNYELKYLNNEGKEKIFEIISHNDYESASEIGQKSSGVSIVALDESLEKMLILKEFRMGVNKQIYNLCAGRMEKGETPEDCIKRELLEESGLELKRVVRILPPSFAAVALSDIKNQIAIVVVKGTPTGKNASATSITYVPAPCGCGIRCSRRSISSTRAMVWLSRRRSTLSPSGTSTARSTSASERLTCVTLARMR